MSKLREKFLEMPRLLNDNIKIMDASRDINVVFDEIRKEIDKLI